MSRGLGERQRELLDALEQAGTWVPLHRLSEDPDDEKANARVRASIRALERRGLVETIRMADEGHLVDTTQISAATDLRSTRYLAEAGFRSWYGTWARLNPG